MDKTDKEVLELCKSWFEDIMERSNRLTSGNVSHGSKAIHGVAKNYAEYVDEYLQNRWKSSDKQMGELYCITEQDEDNIIGKDFITLYNDLKRVKIIEEQ